VAQLERILSQRQRSWFVIVRRGSRLLQLQWAG
jgi:hypothetical protein